VYAVEELLRIGLEPTHFSLNKHDLTLYLPGDVWLRARLMEDAWPDAWAILDKLHEGASLTPVPVDLASSVEAIRPFCPEPKNPVIRFSEKEIRTADGAIQAVMSGFEAQGMAMGAFHADPLSAVLSVANRADWRRFPRVPWTGETGDGILLKGVLMGINL
jgi:hypothetical protein